MATPASRGRAEVAWPDELGVRADAVEPLQVGPAPEERQLATDRRLAPPCHLGGVEAVLAADGVEPGSNAMEDPDAIHLRGHRAEQGASVHRPRGGHPRYVEDRRQYVDRLHVRVVEAAAPLPRQLHQQRHRREILHVPRRDRAALDPHVKADAVVGHHDDERVAEQPEPAHPPEQLAEQAVRESELQQMALVGDLHQPGVAESLRAVQPRNRLRRVAPVVAAGGIELPGHVREQHVLEPERRPLARLDRAHEVAKAAHPSAPEVTRGVALERFAETCRAEAGGLLGCVHLVAVRQEREQVHGVRDHVGAQPGLRVAAVEHRGNRQRGAVVHCGGPSVPRGRAGQTGKGRVAAGIDPTARADEGGERQLVEHDHDDRARAAYAVGSLRGTGDRTMLGRTRGLRVLQGQPEAERDDCKRSDGNNSGNRALPHESAA